MKIHHRGQDSSSLITARQDLEALAHWMFRYIGIEVLLQL